MRVTDLEKFSLEQIWRPYQSIYGYEDRLIAPPVGLEKTAHLLLEDTEWSRCVLDRLRRIGVTFPSYIVHPLVDVVKCPATPKQAETGPDNQAPTNDGLKASRKWGPWTDAQDAFLRGNWNGMATKEIALRLYRSETAVSQRAYKLLKTYVNRADATPLQNGRAG